MHIHYYANLRRDLVMWFPQKLVFEILDKYFIGMMLIIITHSSVIRSVLLLKFHDYALCPFVNEVRRVIA